MGKKSDCLRAPSDSKPNGTDLFCCVALLLNKEAWKECLQQLCNSFRFQHIVPSFLSFTMLAIFECVVSVVGGRVARSRTSRRRGAYFWSLTPPPCLCHPLPWPKAVLCRPVGGSDTGAVVPAGMGPDSRAGRATSWPPSGMKAQKFVRVCQGPWPSTTWPGPAY